jgi:hypothetical protein
LISRSRSRLSSRTEETRVRLTAGPFVIKWVTNRNKSIITIIPEVGGSRVFSENIYGQYASIKYHLKPSDAIKQQRTIIEKSEGKVKDEFLGILNGRRVITWKV